MTRMATVRAAKLLVFANKLCHGVRSVLIFQMGKVGSTTIEHTVRGMGLGIPVYHIHRLSDAGIQRVDRANERASDWKYPWNLAVSKAIRNCPEIIDNGLFVSIVRDPIAIAVSSFFQTCKRHRPHLISGNSIDTELLHDELLQLLRNYRYGDTWIEEEIHGWLGIDIYAFPFDRRRRALVGEAGNRRVLFLRMEDFSQGTERELAAFLGAGAKQVSLRNANVGQEKWYGRQYQEFVSSLNLPEDMVASIYANTRYVRHFYSAEEIEGFRRKWCKV